MLLTEYDEEETMAMFKNDYREDGKLELYIELVCKKLNKGMPINQIARELEEDEARIRAIVDVAEKYAPDYNSEKIMDELAVSGNV